MKSARYLHYLVSPTFRTSPPITGHNVDDLVALAKTGAWPGYFGTPSIATAAAGSRAMIAIAQAAVSVALDILSGTADSEMLRVADLAADPEFKPLVDQALDRTVPPSSVRRHGWRSTTDSLDSSVA